MFVAFARSITLGVLAAGLALALSPYHGHAAAAVSAGPPGDAVRGEAQFKQRCSLCHSADKDAKNAIGPALYGVVGRPNGHAPGFTYSAAMKALKFTWTSEKLNQWIQKPAAMIPGTKMTLAPVSQSQDRADIVAYLKSKSGRASP